MIEMDFSLYYCNSGTSSLQTGFAVGFQTNPPPIVGISSNNQGMEGIPNAIMLVFDPNQNDWALVQTDSGGSLSNIYNSTLNVIEMNSTSIRHLEIRFQNPILSATVDSILVYSVSVSSSSLFVGNAYVGVTTNSFAGNSFSINSFKFYGLIPSVQNLAISGSECGSTFNLTWSTPLSSSYNEPILGYIVEDWQHNLIANLSSKTLQYSTTVTPAEYYVYAFSQFTRGIPSFIFVPEICNFIDDNCNNCLNNISLSFLLCFLHLLFFLPFSSLFISLLYIFSSFFFIIHFSPLYFFPNFFFSFFPLIFQFFLYSFYSINHSFISSILFSLKFFEFDFHPLSISNLSLSPTFTLFISSSIPSDR